MRPHTQTLGAATVGRASRDGAPPGHREPDRPPGPRASGVDRARSKPGALPQFVDRKTLGAELGVSRAVVDAIFRALDVVVLPGCRKVLVKREDVARLLDERTFHSGDVRP